MKPQDISFLIIFLLAMVKRNPPIFAAIGLIFLFLSIPLFAKWIFFTAERFTWYAAFFFLITAISLLFQRKV